MADQMTPIVAKVSPAEKERFFEATELIGTTPSNAIRMFVSAFNREGTFPFDIKAPTATNPKASSSKSSSPKAPKASKAPKTARKKNAKPQGKENTHAR